MKDISFERAFSLKIILLIIEYISYRVKEISKKFDIVRSNIVIQKRRIDHLDKTEVNTRMINDQKSQYRLEEFTRVNIIENCNSQSQL